MDNRLHANVDAINSVPRAAVGRGTFGLIDRLQAFGEPVRVLSAACLFLLVCKTYRMDPREVLQKAENVMADEVGATNPHFVASRDYLTRNRGKHGA